MKSKKHNKLSEEFVSKLAEISAGYLPSATFDKLIAMLQNEIAARCFTRSSESNLLRIISSMYDKFTFLTDCIKYPHYIEIISAISANSNYLSDILVRNPEYFYLVVNPSNLEPKINLKEFEKRTSTSLNYYKTFTSKVNFFRSLKRKEILRIGLRDILGIASLSVVTEELSILAKVTASKLFELCFEEIKFKHQIESFKSSYCLLGLGKLGGFELNYSSDIDLIIFYDEDELIKNKHYHELLTEAIYLFIESASSITSSGFIFRVDFRLRPDGRNSPLCRSLTDYLNYYESRGEDWERQMLIKARFIGGSTELFNKFISYLSPFIFPSSFSTSPTEQIKKLKNNIERNLGDEENIKLIPGGIRDIEFSVQALQLLNGGKWKELRTGNTLKSISILNEKNLLTDNEAETFRNAYHFYRRIEHYLQLMNDKQTHTIPSEGEMLDKISNYLGFDNTIHLKETLKENRRVISRIYNAIMGKEVEVKSKNDISKINFENKKKALQDFTFLREGKGLLGQKEFDEKTISAFQTIELEIISYLAKALNPDITLQNFVRVIKHSNFPHVFYKELSDKKFLKSFLTVCEYSQRTIDLFAEDHELTELLLNRKVFETLTPDMLDQQTVKKMFFTLSLQLILEIIEHDNVSKNLSLFYKQTINKVFNNFLPKKYSKLEFFAAGLGSFGSEEMTFNSDIDFIFVVNDLKAMPNAEKVFQNLLMQIRSNLSSVDVDCRLRPEGKSSTLVWDIKNYDNYIQKRLRIWELQAFTKISFVCGSRELFNSFLDSLKRRIENEESSAIVSEMKDMRRKLYPSDLGGKMTLTSLKKSAGGLIDIEFIAQYLALLSPDCFSIAAGKGVKIIAELPEKVISKDDSEELIRNYLFLKRLDFLNQIIFHTSTSLLPSDKKKLAMLAKQMHSESVESFQHGLNEVMKSNKFLFQKYMAVN